MNKIEDKINKELQSVTRVEVIDQNGRSYINWNSKNKVELRIQDSGLTLKIFISQ